MRPYLAIVSDSFREALYSRVLWLLVVVITLGLAALAPLGYQERITIDLMDLSVRDWPGFLLHLQKQSADSPNSVAARFVGLFDESSVNKLKGFKMPAEGDISDARRFARNLSDLRDAMNQALRKRDFYDAKTWEERQVATDEGRVLLQKGIDKCTDEEVARLNRLLLEAAFPEFVEPSPPVSLQLRYLVWDVLSPLPFRRDQMTSFVETAVATIMKYAVGLIGVIIAVLVTASIIPQTFDPGSLNLLLSKPISRSLLFLSKFFGGCAFILCNAAYLISGLWLILGVRFGVWDPKLLYTIPIYLFMFAIYYTVSALAGVIWRNAIVSIALSILFFLGCWALGLVKWAAETRYVDTHRIVRVFPAGEGLMAINETGTTLEWNSEQSSWNPTFQSDVQRQLEPVVFVLGSIPADFRPIGPVYDSRDDQLISVQRSFRNNQLTFYTGKRKTGWTAQKGNGAPVGTLALLRESDGGVLAVSTLGIHRLSGNLSEKSQPLKVFGMSLPLPAVNPYQSVGPDPTVLIARPWSIVMHPDTGDLLIYSRGTTTVLKREADGNYVRRLERKLDIDPNLAVVVGWSGRTVLVGREDGTLTLYDSDTLDYRGHWETPDKQPPRFIDGAPGGRWFVVTMHGGGCWLVDAEKDEAVTPAFVAKGRVSGAAFASAESLYVVEHGTRVTKYQVSDGKVAERFSPSPGIVDLAYHYFIHPAYTICPKPLRLDDTVTYLLSGKKTVSQDRREEDDLSSARRQLDPWEPVWSSALFVVAMLGIACFYLERQEF